MLTVFTGTEDIPHHSHEFSGVCFYQMYLTLCTVIRCDLTCLCWWIRKNSCRYR